LPIGPLVLAGAIPFLFLHASFQASVSVGVGGASAHAYLSDFAVLVVVLTAAYVGARDGFRPLAPSRLVWIAAGAWLAWIVLSLGWGRHVTASYPLGTHAVTAAKYVEYALLAPATALLVRTRRDVAIMLAALVAWGVVAAFVGLLQFLGVSIFSAADPGSRQGSFLSISDFAALGGAVLLVAFAAIASTKLGLPRAVVAVAAAAGVVSVLVSAAVAAALGIATAVVVLCAIGFRDRTLDRRHLIGVVALALVVGLGVVAYRGGDLASFGRFVGGSGRSGGEQKTVQTYSHHTLLVWIGLEIWKEHPLAGAGWQASADPPTFEPHLAAAHERFPTEPPAAFPSRTRLYGVQNMWAQSLADLGVVGLLLAVATFAAALWRGLRSRRSPAALVGLLWLVLCVWLWAAQGLVAGIPLDALTWLGVGLVAVGAAQTRDSVTVR
jgi:O-antigen ligase